MHSRGINVYYPIQLRFFSVPNCHWITSVTSFSLDNSVLLSNGNDVTLVCQIKLSSALSSFLVLFCYFEQHGCYGNHEIDNKQLITLKNIRI